MCLAPASKYCQSWNEKQCEPFSCKESPKVLVLWGGLSALHKNYSTSFLIKTRVSFSHYRRFFCSFDWLLNDTFARKIFLTANCLFLFLSFPPHLLPSLRAPTMHAHIIIPAITIPIFSPLQKSGTLAISVLHSVFLCKPKNSEETSKLKGSFLYGIFKGSVASYHIRRL